MNSIYVILNKETSEMLTTPKGKWHWSTKKAAESAYTIHMRSKRGWRVENNSIPHLRDAACPYYAKFVYVGYEKEDRSKTLSIKKEIQS